jgi:molybdate transport system substrate-binding protein
MLDEIVSNVALTVLRTSARPTAALHLARYISANDKGLEEFKKHGYSVLAGDDWADVPELKVFSGAMLRPAIEQTLEEFRVREKVKIHVDYNGCGILVGKMKTGDKPDLYFACDPSFMTAVQTSFEKAETASSNDMVIVVARGNPHGIHKLRDLADKKLRLGVGHENQCALGMLTQKRLEDAGLCQQIMKNVKVQALTGDTLVNQLRAQSLDAVIAYASNTVGFDDIEGISLDVPMAKAAQPLAVLKNSQHKHLAERLKAALLSAESKERFITAGFNWSAGTK